MPLRINETDNPLIAAKWRDAKVCLNGCNNIPA